MIFLWTLDAYRAGWDFESYNSVDDAVGYLAAMDDSDYASYPVDAIIEDNGVIIEGDELENMVMALELRQRENVAKMVKLVVPGFAMQVSHPKTGQWITADTSEHREMLERYANELPSDRVRIIQTDLTVWVTE